MTQDTLTGAQCPYVAYQSCKLRGVGAFRFGNAHLCREKHESATSCLFQEVVDDPSGNKMLLVMDYMEGGPVMTREALERGRCIPESLACQYFRDMCKVSLLPFNCQSVSCLKFSVVAAVFWLRTQLAFH